MVPTGSLSRMSTRDSGDCAAMRVTSEGERSQAAPVAALPGERLRLGGCFEFFMIYLPLMGNKTWGRQSSLWTRFLARPGAGWKAGGSDDWRVLNRFGETTNGQPVPLGKPWDRQPNFGKLRRKLVSVPGLRRISGQLSPKRLSTPSERSSDFYLPLHAASRAKRRPDSGASNPSSTVEIAPNPAALPRTPHLKHAAGAGPLGTSAVIAAPPTTVPIAIHWYRRSPARIGVCGSPRYASSLKRPIPVRIKYSPPIRPTGACTTHSLVITIAIATFHRMEYNCVGCSGTPFSSASRQTRDRAWIYRIPTSGLAGRPWQHPCTRQRRRPKDCNHGAPTQ